MPELYVIDRRVYLRTDFYQPTRLIGEIRFLPNRPEGSQWAVALDLGDCRQTRFYGLFPTQQEILSALKSLQPQLS